MLTITIKSYDSHFDTFAVKIVDDWNDKTQETLIPSCIIPYIALELCTDEEEQGREWIPSVVGKTFVVPTGWCM